MADQQSSHLALISAVNTYYEKKTLEDFEPKTVWYAQAPLKSEIPQGSGKTIQWTRYLKIAGQRSDNTSEFTATQIYQSASTVSATIHSRDFYVQLSRTTVLTAISNALNQAADNMKEAAAKTVDLLIRNDIGMIVADQANATSLNMNNMAIDGGTLNSTGKTARVWSHDKSAGGDRFPVYHNKIRLAQSALVTSFAKTALTVKTIQAGVKALEENDIPPCTDGYYRLISPIGAAYQITTQPGFKGWMQYTSSEGIKKSPTEVGIVAGVRIFSSNLALQFPLSADTLSTASGSLYCSLLYGKEAFGCAKIAGENGEKGFSFFLKESGPQTTSDPTNMIKQVAASVTNVGKVLNKSAGLWITSTSIV